MSDRARDPPLRPTHFVAFQIKDGGVLKELDKVVESIKLQNPELGRKAVSVPKSHVSLFVLQIEPESESEVLKVFKEVSCRHRQEFKTNPVELNLRDVEKRSIDRGHWLLYSKVGVSKTHMSQIYSLANDLKEELAKVKGVRLNNYRNIDPHVSLLNTKIGGGPPQEISQELYEDYASLNFGTQKVSEVQLLSMKKPVTEAGYYYCESEVPLR